MVASNKKCHLDDNCKKVLFVIMSPLDFCRRQQIFHRIILAKYSLVYAVVKRHC